MNSVTTERFRKAYSNLPVNIREAAKKTFQLWKKNPSHPGLRFKQVHKSKPVYSVRIGIGWRAVGIREADTMIWFWIGSHSEYDKLVSKM